MRPNYQQSKGKTKPHLWRSEIALLVQQSLSYVSGSEVLDNALSKAKYHRQDRTWREPFYLRQYGGHSLLDQIVVEFSPKDDLASRRAVLTMNIKGIVEQDVRARLSENLLINGYIQGITRETGSIEYSDGRNEIEVFFYQEDENVSISIRGI